MNGSTSSRPVDPGRFAHGLGRSQQPDSSLRSLRRGGAPDKLQARCDAAVVSELIEQSQAFLGERSGLIEVALVPGYSCLVAQAGGDVARVSQLAEQHRALHIQLVRRDVVAPAAGEVPQAAQRG